MRPVIGFAGAESAGNVSSAGGAMRYRYLNSLQASNN